jgi:NAD(P)-dependent dehydrogenase (short-subunit alcohol dehydrogenase family)
MMEKLAGKKAVVIGGAQGTGLAIVYACLNAGADVLVVDQDEMALKGLAFVHPNAAVLHADAREEATAKRVLEAMPDIVVLAAGAIPPLQPVQELDWEAFSNNWNTDVKAAFHLVQAALTTPAKPGTQIMVLSSGAAIFGSPITGGYGGAKRMQMFLANYGQAESNRLGLGLRFLALAPWRLMQATGVAEVGIPAYAAYLGMSEENFIAGMTFAQTKEDVANMIVELSVAPPAIAAGNVFVASGKGIVAEADIQNLLLGKQ